MPIIVSTSTGTARPSSFAALKLKVARPIGGTGDDDILTAAGEFINEVIVELNTRLYEFNKINPSVITCTNGVGTLPTPFFKEVECQLVNSDGTKIRQLQYRDWAEYQQTFNFQGITGGALTYYTIFNQHNTGQITLLPTPSTGTQYVDITYYRRIPLLDAEEEILDATQELERVIVLKAQTEAMRIFAPENPLLPMTSAMADRAWDALTHIDIKHPDMKPRRRLANIAGLQRVTWADAVYIKV